MQDSILIKAPAKLNLFLRILGKKDTGLYKIRSGITFLDLYDELKIKLSDINNISYSGLFKPTQSRFENDIIDKVVNQISFIDKKIKVDIQIQKNIPWKAGLGSSSTDAASLIKGFQKLGLIKEVDNQFLSSLGADIPVCFHGKNCLVTGIGDEIHANISYPNYFFILVKPNIHLSTSEMYSKIKEYLTIDHNYIEQTKDLQTLYEEDKGNDFEIIAKKDYKQIEDLLGFLSNLDQHIFSGMTGSGSCCYAAFNKKNQAKKAFVITKKNFSDYWVYFAENNKKFNVNY